MLQDDRCFTSMLIELHFKEIKLIRVKGKTRIRVDGNIEELRDS